MARPRRAGRWLGLVAVLAACGDSGGTAPRDAGPDAAGNPGYAGCGAAATPYLDRTRADADRTFMTGDATSVEYSPRCLRVRRGQLVDIFSSTLHPLMPAAGNPGPEIVAAPDAILHFTLDSLGVYGFYCARHGTPSGGGQAGAIEVVP